MSGLDRTCRDQACLQLLYLRLSHQYVLGLRGGKSSFSTCKRVLTSKGIYLTTAPKLSIMLQMMWTSLFKGKRAIFAKANLAFLMDLASNGALNAVIDRRYPLELLPDAHKYVETERKKGNVIIHI